MNKTVKMILAAAGALVLGGLGEGIGAELLKKAAKADDAAEDANDANEDATVTAEESDDDIVFEEVTDETED